MVKYALAKLTYSYYGLSFQATHPSIADWFLSEIEGIAPDRKVENLGERGVGVDMRDKAEAGRVAWRMLQQLCENGWEPFAYSTSTPFNSSDLAYTYGLRLKQE